MPNRGLLLLLALGLHAPSVLAFDCAKASTPVEKTICADAGLKALDDRLGPLFRRALDATPDPVTVRTVQRNWLVDRNACATDRDCIEQHYQQRLSRLDDYIAALDDDATSFVDKATADQTCIRYVPPEAPNAQLSCQVIDWSPLGEIGGFTRVAAVYKVAYGWNGQQRLSLVPALLTWNPGDAGRLALDYWIGDVADSEGARPVAELRPKPVKGAGERLEYRFTRLDGKPDVRRYGLADGQWASIP